MTSAGSSVWISFLGYLLVTFALAWAARRKASSGPFFEEFFVGGRQIGPWVLGLTWIATSASGGSFIGTPSLAHANGWSVMLWISGYIVVATVGFGLLGKRVAEVGRRTGALTLPDLLRDRFASPAIGAVSALAIVILHVSYMVAQYIAGARVMEVLLDIPYEWGIVGFAVTVGFYTSYGGFRAVAWTDAFQAIVMLFGVLVTLGFALDKVGGFGQVWEGLAAQSADLLTPEGPEGFLPWQTAVSFFVIWPFATAGQPALMARYLACRDRASLKRAAFLIGLYILLLYPAVIMIGIIGRVLVPELEAADHAMPATILACTPPVLAGLVLAAPMAAIMSTLSSFLLVSSSAVVRDFLPAKPERAAQREQRPSADPDIDFRDRRDWFAVRAPAAPVPAVHRGVFGHGARGDLLVSDSLRRLLVKNEQGRLSRGHARRVLLIRTAIRRVRHAELWRIRPLRLVSGSVRIERGRRVANELEGLR